MQTLNKTPHFEQLGSLSIASAKKDSAGVQTHVLGLYGELLKQCDFEAVVDSLEQYHFLDSKKPQFRWFGAEWDHFVHALCPDIKQLETPEQYQAFETANGRPHKNDPRWESSLPVGEQAIRLLSRQATLDDLAQVIFRRKLDGDQFARILGQGDLDLAEHLIHSHWTPAYSELEKALDFFVEHNDCTPETLALKDKIEALIFEDLARRDEVGQELDEALLDKDTATLLKLVDDNPRLLTLRSKEQEQTLQHTVGESFLQVVFSEIPLAQADGSPNPFFDSLAKKLQNRYHANSVTGKSNISLAFAADCPDLQRFLVERCKASDMCPAASEQENPSLDQKTNTSSPSVKKPRAAKTLSVSEQTKAKNSAALLKKTTPKNARKLPEGTREEGTRPNKGLDR